MALISQIVDISLYASSVEQFSDAIDQSDRRYLFVFYKYGAIIPCH